MAFAPKNPTAMKTSIDKRLDKLNNKLRIARAQKIFKNPNDFGLRYIKRTWTQKQRTIADQNYRCAMCQYDLTKSNANHIDDYDPATNEPRGIICKECSKVLKRAKTLKYLKQEFVDYLNKYKIDT